MNPLKIPGKHTKSVLPTNVLRHTVVTDNFTLMYLNTVCHAFSLVQYPHLIHEQ